MGAARAADASLVFDPSGTGRWRVRGGTEPYTIVADAQGGLACTCYGFRFRNRCRHVAELARRQAEARVTVPESTGAEDPVAAALERSGMLHVTRAGDEIDGEVRPALHRLGTESAHLSGIDRALVSAEATQHLVGLGVSERDAARLVDAALEVGRSSGDGPGPHLRLETREEIPLPDSRDAPASSEVQPQAVTAAPEARQPLLRSLETLLADPESLKPPEAVVPRLAYRARVSLVIGREKSGGKSTLLTAGSAAVSTGRDFLGERCPTGPVLWVTADQEHAAEITQRAARFGADPARFFVLWPRQAFADLHTALAQVMPVLLVIDTLANFAQVDDPHSSAEWPRTLLPLLVIARERQLAVALAHHAKKSEGGGYRDSTAIGANVDLLLELRPDTGNVARRHVSVLGRWPAANFTVELVGDRYQVVAGGELSLDARILVYIEGHPGCSQASVRNHVGGRAQDADEALARLLTQRAVRDSGGKGRHAYEATAATPTLPLSEGDDVPF